SWVVVAAVETLETLGQHGLLLFILVLHQLMILIDDAQTTIIQSTVIASLVKMLERQEASTAAKTLGTLTQYGMFLVNSSLFPLIVSVDEARTIIIHLNTMSLLGK